MVVGSLFKMEIRYTSYVILLCLVVCDGNPVDNYQVQHEVKNVQPTLEAGDTGISGKEVTGKVNDQIAIVEQPQLPKHVEQAPVSNSSNNQSQKLLKPESKPKSTDKEIIPEESPDNVPLKNSNATRNKSISHPDPPQFNFQVSPPQMSPIADSSAKAEDKQTVFAPKAEDKQTVFAPKAEDKQTVFAPKAEDKQTVFAPKAEDKQTVFAPKDQPELGDHIEEQPVSVFPEKKEPPTLPEKKDDPLSRQPLKKQSEANSTAKNSKHEEERKKLENTLNTYDTVEDEIQFPDGMEKFEFIPGHENTGSDRPNSMPVPAHKDDNVGPVSAVLPSENGLLYDDTNSHFFAYFLTLMVMAVLCYLLFHNKQRIIALLIEGRRGRPSRRNSARAKYHKLDNNLEEAMSSTRGSSVSPNGSVGKIY